MKRVLLTGATGFVGRACIAPLIARGYSVHTISIGRRPPPDGVTIWQGDLLDTGRIGTLVEEIAPSHLLHAAWDVTHGSYWSASANLDWLAAGIALLRAFVSLGGQRAVGVGTCAEYGWTVDRYPEFGSPLEPSTRYGRSKLELCRAFQAASELNVSVAWARLFFPFGPREHKERLLPSVINRLIVGEPVDCTAGTQVRDFLYIDDVGSALAALLDSFVEGPVNIASGQGTAVRDMILLAANQIGRPDLVRLGVLPMRPGDPHSLVAETERLNQEVGFSPTVTLQDGIQQTIAYWTKHGGTARIHG